MSSVSNLNWIELNIRHSHSLNFLPDNFFFVSSHYFFPSIFYNLTSTFFNAGIEHSFVQCFTSTVSLPVITHSLEQVSTLSCFDFSDSKNPVLNQLFKYTEKVTYTLVQWFSQVKILYQKHCVLLFRRNLVRPRSS